MSADQPFNVADIDKTEELLKQHYERISSIENQLRRRNLSPEEEDTAKEEVEDIKKTLKEHERALKRLRTENRRTLAMVVVFVLIFGSLYVLFNLVYQLGWVARPDGKDLGEQEPGYLRTVNSI